MMADLQLAMQSGKRILVVGGTRTGKTTPLSAICNFLPEGARFAALDAYVADEDGGDPMAWAFGALGTHDRARHLATLYLNDVADVLREAIDPRFEFVRYAEQLATSQPSFEPLAQALAAPPHLIDRTLQRLALWAGLVSVASFLWLARRAAPLNAPLARVVRADGLALPPLLAALVVQALQ